MILFCKREEKREDSKNWIWTIIYHLKQITLENLRENKNEIPITPGIHKRANLSADLFACSVVNEPSAST